MNQVVAALLHGCVFAVHPTHWLIYAQVELCGADEAPPTGEAPAAPAAGDASPRAASVAEALGPVAARVKMDPAKYALTTRRPRADAARPPPKVLPAPAVAAGAAGALELAAVPQDDRLAPTVRSTKLEKRQPVPAAPVRYEAVNGVGPLIPARLQKALTATIAPLLEAHERALPEVKERLRRRVHFGERWRNHEEFFRTADPLLLRSVDANATRLNKNLLKHARLADDCNLKLEGLVGLTEARAAERAEDFYLTRAMDAHGHLSETMKDWGAARRKEIGAADLARGLQERPASRVKMIEADALPDKEVLAGTRRGLPPVETVTTIRRPGRPADELANSRDERAAE